MKGEEGGLIPSSFWSISVARAHCGSPRAYWFLSPFISPPWPLTPGQQGSSQSISGWKNTTYLNVTRILIKQNRKGWRYSNGGRKFQLRLFPETFISARCVCVCGYVVRSWRKKCSVQSCINSSAPSPSPSPDLFPSPSFLSLYFITGGASWEWTFDVLWFLTFSIPLKWFLSL